MPLIDPILVASILRETAAEEVLPRWRNLGEADVIEKEGPDDLVTIADRATERVLTRRLADALAGSQVVGEEAAHADPTILTRLKGTGPTWVIDPIDGTSAFAKGSDAFAVMVGLVDGGALVAGFIYQPVADILLLGEHGGGVWQWSEAGRTRLSPPQTSHGLGSFAGIAGRKLMTDAIRQRLAAASGEIRGVSNSICAGIDYAHLLTGSAQFALYTKSEPWDHLPGLALASELGFHYARHDGSDYRPGDNTGGLLIAPDAATWAQLHSLVLI